VDIFLLFSIIFFEIKRKKEKQCKEEVILGVGSFFKREQAGQRKARASRPCFCFFVDRSFFFTQPSQCERMIAQGPQGL